jgi:hypothetical protein
LPSSLRSSGDPFGRNSFKKGSFAAGKTGLIFLFSSSKQALIAYQKNKAAP